MTTAMTGEGPVQASAPEDVGTDSSVVPAVVFVEVVRLLIVALFTAAGHELAGGGGDGSEGMAPVLGALLGACLGYVHGGMVGRWLRRAMGSVEEQLERVPAAALLVGAVAAIAAGCFGAVAGAAAVLMLPGRWGWPILALLTWMGLYVGFQVGARKGEELLGLLRHGPGSMVAAPGAGPEMVLVDSSAAIDGRLAQLAGLGMLPGRPAVPRFVIDELQGIADAGDPGRRRRGRRGLEILDRLRDDPRVGLDVLDDEVPERRDVDAKLVALAVRSGAAIVTTDGNLVRVAELQGVRCVDLNAVAEALRAPIVPGEVVRLTVTRHGREQGQGVGFLDDGTMVVITGGFDLVGQEVDVVVTSSVHTSKGLMLFASVAA